MHTYSKPVEAGEGDVEGVVMGCDQFLYGGFLLGCEKDRSPAQPLLFDTTPPLLHRLIRHDHYGNEDKNQVTINMINDLEYDVGVCVFLRTHSRSLSMPMAWHLRSLQA